VIRCKARAASTSKVRKNINGKFNIVKIAGPEDLSAYLDRLYPFHRKMAKKIAVDHTRMSLTGTGIAKAGSRIPWIIPQGKLLSLSCTFVQLLAETLSCCIVFVLTIR
jgi:hypothetical protein